MVIHSYIPNPIFFTIGPINLYWYGILISCGILLGFLVSIKLAKKYRVEEDVFCNLTVYMVIFGVVGARFYHILLEFSYYLNNPIKIFFVWEGGLAIHGAIIGGALTLFWFIKKRAKNKLNFFLLADIIVPALALGQAIGRWGNYFNQELFGKPTDLPWGIPIEFLNRMEGYREFEFFHPTFLYESILNLIIFLIILNLHNARFKKNTNWLNKIINSRGNIFLIYLIFYSLVRFSTEFIRIDQTPIFAGLRFPQVASLGLITFSILAITLHNSKKQYFIKKT